MAALRPMNPSMKGYHKVYKPFFNFSIITMTEQADPTVFYPDSLWETLNLEILVHLSFIGDVSSLK